MIYQALTRFNSEAIACFNHIVANAITSEIRPVLRWKKGEKTIKLIPGLITFKASQERRTSFASFSVFSLPHPKVAVLNRETGMLEWVNPQDLYDFAIGNKRFEGPLQILSRGARTYNSVIHTYLEQEHRVSLLILFL